MRQRQINLIGISVKAQWVLDAEQVLSGGGLARCQKFEWLLGGRGADEAVHTVIP